MSAPLLDSCSLQHIKVRKSTCRGVSRPHYVPSSGFDHPLDGLLLPSPCRPFFVPAALLGFHPSELSPLERYPKRHRLGWTHMPFFLLVSPVPKHQPFPAGRDFWASTLSRVPCDSACVWHANSPDTPLGFHPSRVFLRQPRSRSLSISSRALSCPAPGEAGTTAPQSIDRLSLRPPRTRRQAAEFGTNNPLRVLTPVRS